MAKTQNKEINERLKNFASPLKAQNNFIKASFGGFAGSGKTFTATHFIIGAYREYGCKKPILLIDNEKGSRFLIPIFNKAGIECYVKDTVKLADVLEAMQMLKDGLIDFLFVDTLTKVWYDYIKDYKLKNRVTFMSLQDWGKILPAWQEMFSDVFVGCEGNIVFTGRGGFQYEKEEDIKNEQGVITKKGSFVKSGVKMKLAGETPFEPDLNVWMEQEQELNGDLKTFRTANVMKDRSGLIDGQLIINPTYKDFQPVVKFLMAQPIGEVKGTSTNENLSPSENYDWYKEKEQREILHDKIKTLFEKHGFGTSKEDKQLKAIIVDKTFHTTSSEEIKKFNSTVLTEGFNKVNAILNHIENIPEASERINIVKELDDAEIDNLVNKEEVSIFDK